MADQAPSPGDVLVKKREQDGHFEISVVPGDAQVSVRQKFEAMRQAHEFAAHHGASVWFTEPDGGYTRIDRPRPKES